MRYEVAIAEETDARLREHLLRHYQHDEAQEDLCFATWQPSTGQERFCALIDEPILPEPDERALHGNASFTPDYLGRAVWAACRHDAGLAFLHSHPAGGWQGMSRADIEAERDIIAYPAMATGFPLVGLTAGVDGYWSARLWIKVGSGFRCHWCAKVRVVGASQYRIYHNDTILPPPRKRERLRRTYDTWGRAVQSTIARLHVGVVGLGSVGSVVAESLARIGVGRLTLIDPDRVEEHNLDRLLFASAADIGKRKVDLAKRALRGSMMAERASIVAVPLSIHRRLAYARALDCDLIFSCVDKPVARDVLNFIANCHLIPVVDGGVAIEVDPLADSLFSAHWRAHLVTPEHQCLRCNGQYDTSMVVMELDGSLEDPSYVTNLPLGSQLGGQNVFPFSAAVATMEVNRMLRYLMAREWWPVVQQEDYQFVTVETRHISGSCRPGCPFPARRGRGDTEVPHYLDEGTPPERWCKAWLRQVLGRLKRVGKRWLKL